MDFNINNESFGKAYMCLSDANILLESGLGNFNELDYNALHLINSESIENNSKLNSMICDCQELKDRMYNTMEYLSKIDVESAFCFQTFLEDCTSFSTNMFDYESLDVTSYNKVSSDGIKYHVDIIGSVSKNTPVILFNHGGDSAGTIYGTGGDYSYYEEWLNNNENEKFNAIIIRYDRDSNNSINSYKLLEEVVK